MLTEVGSNQKSSDPPLFILTHILNIIIQLQLLDTKKVLFDIIIDEIIQVYATSYNYSISYK